MSRSNEQAVGGWWLRMLAVTAIVAGALVQARGSIRHGPLALEDGAILFARSFQAFSVADWWASYSGYVTLIPNVLASLVCRLPTPWIPHAFAVVAALLAAAPALALLHRGYEPLAGWAARCRMALALAWLPLGNCALAGTLQYSAVPLLGWLTLLVLRPGSTRGLACVAEPLLVFALTWTHPLAILLVPFAVRGILRRERVPTHVAMLVGAATYLAFGHRGDLPHHPEALSRLPAVLAVRVGFESIAGTRAKLWLGQSGLDWVAAFVGGLALLLVVLGAARTWPQWSSVQRRFAGAASVLIPGFVAAALWVRAVPTAEEMWSQRYVLVPRYLFVGLGMLLAERRYGARAATLLAVSVGVATTLGNRLVYRVAANEVPAFVARLAAEEQRLGGREAIRAELPRGDWPIRISPR